MAAAPPPKTNTGFVSLADYINANRDAIGTGASALSDIDEQKAQQAEGAADRVAGQVNGSTQDPTQISGFSDAQNKLNDAAQSIRGLSTFGGLSQQLQDTAKSPYTEGDRSLDANMLQGAAPPRFGELQQKYGGLENYLNNAVESRQAKFASLTPPAPAPAGWTPDYNNPSPNYSPAANDPGNGDVGGNGPQSSNDPTGNGSGVGSGNMGDPVNGLRRRR